MNDAYQLGRSGVNVLLVLAICTQSFHLLRMWSMHTCIHMQAGRQAGTHSIKVTYVTYEAYATSYLQPVFNNFNLM